MTLEITAGEIEKMPYTTFVGFINQWNVPPGAYKTIGEWINFGFISKESDVLEIACTTGFSLREISQITGCKGLGIDISEKSVETAIKNRDQYTSDLDIEYKVANALDYKTDKRYTHLVIGAALRFFDEPILALKIFSENHLKNNGWILSNEFVCTGDIPSDLVSEAKDTFDIKPTIVGLDEVLEPYMPFTRFYIQIHDIRKESSQELEHYCSSIIHRAKNHLKIDDKQLIDACYERLMRIKKVANELRSYQQYMTLVHRYSELEYGYRFTEHF